MSNGDEVNRHVAARQAVTAWVRQIAPVPLPTPRRVYVGEFTDTNAKALIQWANGREEVVLILADQGWTSTDQAVRVIRSFELSERSEHVGMWVDRVNDWADVEPDRRVMPGGNHIKIRMR